MRILLLAAALTLSFCAPQGKNHQSKRIPLLQKAELQAGDNGQLDYLAHFQTSAEAEHHASQVAAAGGSIEFLDRSHRIQRVTLTATAAEGIEVADSVSVANNAAMMLNRAAAETATFSDNATSYLSARQVTGVEDLVARFPEADGRGTLVAVFDTGVEFGLRGISADRKLKGFYDFSGFGLVTASAYSGEQGLTYQVGGYTLSLPADSSIRVVASGVLSEPELAKAYLTESIDINGNSEDQDEFPFVIATGEGDTLEVVLDMNRDGSLDLATETLTDFNTTGSYLQFDRQTTPDGAYPLAVTITSATELQFHAVRGGHGTSCAAIIGGDGFANGDLLGMAPKTQFLSYLLDFVGQDVYTMDQFVKMFVHAKEQQVDAISISWGFTTADLASARFFADFLDKEIVSAGIVIGIAAGNEGPAFGSGTAVDYIPHHGFGVGAMVSEVQARNVYSWLGDLEDSVVWYSSIGPTRGGRLIPDVISPLMSLVRGERSNDANPFYPFGGTSSATPALIGSVTALVSKLKQENLAIEPRLIKLAIQKTARVLETVETVRQGAGVINVNLAYDVYLQLVAEFEAAKADSRRQTKFAYDLRALEQVSGKEGIHLTKFQSTALMQIKLTEESLALVDQNTFVDNLLVTHQSDFFETPDAIALQAGGAKLGVRFIAENMTSPGIYQDIIEVRRQSDQLTLLRIPVVVQVPAAFISRVLASESRTFAPFDLIRKPFTLPEASAVELTGMYTDPEGGTNGYLGFFVSNMQGHLVFSYYENQDAPFKSISQSTGELPAGDYELIVFRGFSSRGGANLNPIQFQINLTLPLLEVTAARVLNGALDIALLSYKTLNAAKATLEFASKTLTISLTKDLSQERPGFYGVIDQYLPKDVSIGLFQSSFDRLLDDHMHMTVALVDNESGSTLYRGWVEHREQGAPLTDISLAKESASTKVVAYPNIVNWSDVTTQEIKLTVNVPRTEPVTLTKEADLSLARGGVMPLTFELPNTEEILSGTGTLTLLDASGNEVGRASVPLN